MSTFVSTWLLQLALLLAVGSGSAQNSVSKMTADMGARLLTELRSGPKPINAVVSPLSIAIGMGMLHQGADGVTRRDLAGAIGLPDDDQQVRRDFEATIPENSNFTSLSSLIAVAKDSDILNSYAEVVRRTFNGSPFQHTFDTKPGFASYSINQWVQKRSGGKIKQLLPRGSVSKQTKMVLVNVLSYKSEWLNPFDLLADPLPFTTSEGTEISLKMMNTEQQFGAAVFADDQTVVSIPLADNTTDLVLVYPGQGRSVDTSLRALQTDQELIGSVLDPESLPQKQVALTVPKFKLSGRLKLKQAFRSVYPGASSIFAANADFSRMAEQPAGILVDEIHHVAVLDVDEKGVEAVGATGVAITLYSFFEPELTVDVQSPFLALLVNKETNAVLFAGAVEDPTVGR